MLKKFYTLFIYLTIFSVSLSGNPKSNGVIQIIMPNNLDTVFSHAPEFIWAVADTAFVRCDLLIWEIPDTLMNKYFNGEDISPEISDSAKLVVSVFALKAGFDPDYGTVFRYRYPFNEPLNENLDIKPGKWYAWQVRAYWDVDGNKTEIDCSIPYLFFMCNKCWDRIAITTYPRHFYTFSDNRHLEKIISTIHGEPRIIIKNNNITEIKLKKIEFEKISIIDKESQVIDFEVDQFNIEPSYDHYWVEKDYMIIIGGLSLGFVDYTINHTKYSDSLIIVIYPPDSFLSIEAKATFSCGNDPIETEKIFSFGDTIRLLSSKSVLFIVDSVVGSVQIKWGDSEEWVTLVPGMIIPWPYGWDCTIFTDIDSWVNLRFGLGNAPNNLIHIGQLSNTKLHKFFISESAVVTRLKIKQGMIRVKVTESSENIKTDMKLSTPNLTASPTGTDFSVSYDSITGISVTEVYDDTVWIERIYYPDTLIISGDENKGIGQRITVDMDGNYSIGDFIFTPVSLNNIKQNQPLYIYPNPCNNYFILSGNNMYSELYDGFKAFRIYNILGQCVLESNFQNFPATIDISGLPSQVYFLRTGGVTLKFAKK